MKNSDIDQIILISIAVRTLKITNQYGIIDTDYTSNAHIHINRLFTLKRRLTIVEKMCVPSVKITWSMIMLVPLNETLSILTKTKKNQFHLLVLQRDQIHNKFFSMKLMMDQNISVY